ncbi:MAG: hypothetical protein A2Y53_08865 [Chloroflexi bacterium RBG_16_47_49]|nr:MAG: hypothetical protein A2Y53_08865 [Chloroflexi bacterium RBG_16_47_49]
MGFAIHQSHGLISISTTKPLTLPIAGHVMRMLCLRTTILVNALRAMSSRHGILSHLIMSWPEQSIVSPAMPGSNLRTITQDSVRIAIIQWIGLRFYLTIRGLSIVVPAMPRSYRRIITLDNVRIVIILPIGLRLYLTILDLSIAGLATLVMCLLTTLMSSARGVIRPPPGKEQYLIILD